MSGVPATVLYEEAMDLDFLDEVFRIPGGEKIRTCIQCGTCSGSCPVSWAMEETPRQLFAMIRAGMRDKVLQSETIWVCASCYSCTVRCPKQIKITDVMYALKRMAIREAHRRGRPAQMLSEIFVTVVNRFGRNHEPLLMTRFLMATDIKAAFAQAPIGFALLTRGRLPMPPTPIKGIAGLRAIIAKARELGV